MSKDWSWKTFWGAVNSEIGLNDQADPGKHVNMWGKQVPNDEREYAATAGTALGWIGTVVLTLGIICLVVSFNNTSLASAHTALTTMICGIMATVIGSFALIALLAVKANRS